MTTFGSLDAAGRRRSPATMPSFHRGRPPRNKGLQYPADPPAIEEIVAVMRCAGDTPHGLRTRALIVVLWRAGLRISEALSLAETDLDLTRGSILIRRGKGGKRRSAWTPGLGNTSTPGLSSDSRCASELCCASSTAPRKAGPGRPPPPAPPSGTSRSRPVSADASRRTSSATRTQSKWPVKASHSTSSNAN
jgi:Phage integrase family